MGCGLGGPSSRVLVCIVLLRPKLVMVLKSIGAVDIISCAVGRASLVPFRKGCWREPEKSLGPTLGQRPHNGPSKLKVGPQGGDPDTITIMCCLCLQVCSNACTNLRIDSEAKSNGMCNAYILK